MAEGGNTSLNIFQIVSMNTLRNAYHRFFPKHCRICLLLVKDNLSTFCADSVTFNEEEITLPNKLIFCCPELDLRISPKAMLCVNCFETIHAVYQLSYKFDKNKSQFHENFSFPFSNVQNSLFENYCYTAKLEIKTEEVDLCDTEKDYPNKFTQIESKHAQHIHTREIPFKCYLCSYRSTTKDNLKMHLRNHSGEKSFTCSMCDYSTFSNRNLKKHLLIHTGEKPFKCSLCDYSFRQNNHLKKHLRIHTGEKPFKCSQCDYSCRQNNDLKQHFLIHTGEKPFKCSVCDYSCRQNNHLKRHVLIHTGEKPFKCSQCNYSCRQNTCLKKHFLIHTRENPFKCSVCDYSSTTKSKLLRHLLIHKRQEQLK